MKGGEESWGATGMPSQFYNPKKPLVGYPANSGFGVPTTRCSKADTRSNQTPNQNHRVSNNIGYWSGAYAAGLAVEDA